MTVIITSKQDLSRLTRWLMDHGHVQYTTEALPGGTMAVRLDSADYAG